MKSVDRNNKYYLKLSKGSLYPYTIVRSSRAKYTRIKLSKEGELRLVISLNDSIKQGQKFIQEKLGWIEKHLDNISPIAEVLPRVLDLQLLGEQWKIEYIKEESDRLLLSPKDDFVLEIKGDISDNLTVKKLLNKWCQYKARYIFTSMLDDISNEFSLDYNRLTVRSQKTRWGSCSQKKNINLNSKLLFFKEAIVRYVMIHELCHTVEMNHSKRFWRLVENCDPDYLLNQKQLKEYSKKIPL